MKTAIVAAVKCALPLAAVVTVLTTAHAAVTNIAWYRLGENDPGAANGLAVTNTTTDLVGGNHLKQYNGPLYTSAVSSGASNRVGSSLAVNLNGVNQFFSNAVASTAVNNFGLEAWVKPNSTSGLSTGIAYNGTSGDGWGLIQNGTEFSANYGGANVFVLGPVVIGTWTHLALVRDNGTTILYYNGAAVGTSSSGPSPPTTGFEIGARAFPIFPEFFNGTIDEVRVFTFAPGQFSTTDLLVNLQRAATLPPTSLSATGVTLNGQVNAAGLPTSAWFEWGTTTNYGNTTPPQAFAAGAGSPNFSQVLTGLLGGVTYHFRAVATNSTGTSFGGDVAFTTLNPNTNLSGRTLLTGSLANFDVRYPNSLPNDLEIVLYGAGLRTNDVTSTYFNSQWGSPASITGGVNTDTNSPAFGLDGVVVRYVGPPLPAQVDQFRLFGVQLRAAAVVNQQEVWWTINGQRVQRPEVPQVAWSYNPGGWLISVANPNTIPIYVYGCRFFPVTNTVPLPTLNQLNTSISPTAFGATNWTSLNPPSGRVFGLQPWSRIYFHVQSVTPLPIVFQVAARTVPEAVLPLPNADAHPDPSDWNGEQGTTVILTTRPTQEFAEDINGDGVVDLNDLNAVLANVNSGVVNQSVLDAVLSNYWPNSPFLYMTNVAGLGGTNVTFALTNSLAGAFSVEYTTNLMDWQLLGPATPRYLFTDTNAPALPRRHYRLRYP